MDAFKDFRFQGIGPDEKIIKILHRNWLDIVSQYFLVFLATGIFFLGINIYPMIFPQFDGTEYNILFLFIQNTFLLAIWIYSFLIWVDYYLDIWVITSEKIINIEQKGLFLRRVSSAKYEKIQDVTVEVTGFLQTVVNFGDVRVQTAGELENIVFRRVSDPYEVKNLIAKIQKEKEVKGMDAFGEMIKEKAGSKSV